MTRDLDGSPVVPSKLNIFVAQLHVPFLCDGEAEYDGYPFKTYPIHKRWSQAVDDLL